MNFMFVKIVRKKYNGKEYRHAELVETFREKGKIKHKLIRNLGSMKSKEDEERVLQLADSMKSGKMLFSLNEANEKSFEYGVYFVVKKIWEKLNMNVLFYSKKTKIDLNDLLPLLIAHRLHNYGSCNLSEREAHRWICKEAYSKIDRLSLQQVYRTLYLLFKKKNEIERHLCNTLNTKSEVIFYDLTSSYLEGDYDESNLVDFGYNRDKKKGKKQIVLGLLLKDNLPIAHEVWRGNTADKSTLKEAVMQTKSLGINNFIFVADRGIITEKNIEFIEDEKLQYIIATQRRKGTLVKELMQKEITTEVEKVYYDSKTKRAYYLCYNKQVALVQLGKLKKMKKTLEKKISELKKPSEHKVYSMLGKTAKYFKFKFAPFSFEINKEINDYEKSIAGKYLLITNNLKLSADDIKKTYKQLAEIERAFGEIKHLENMRPLFHKKDDAIKAHIFLCVLTLFIERYIQAKVKTATARQLLAELKMLKLSKINKFYVRTELSNEQNRILKALNIEEPVKIM